MDDELVADDFVSQTKVLKRKPSNTVDYMHLKDEQYKKYKLKQKTADLLSPLNLLSYQLDEIFEQAASIKEGTFKGKVIFSAYSYLKNDINRFKKDYSSFFKKYRKEILKYSVFKPPKSSIAADLLLSSLRKLKDKGEQYVLKVEEQFDKLKEGHSYCFKESIERLKNKVGKLVEYKQTSPDEQVIAFIYSEMLKEGFKMRKDVFSKLLGFKTVNFKKLLC